MSVEKEIRELKAQADFWERKINNNQQVIDVCIQENSLLRKYIKSNKEMIEELEAKCKTQ